MGSLLTGMGNLNEQGITPLLAQVSGEGWSGVLRVRSREGIGAVWFVKGQLAHALLLQGEQRDKGIEALKALSLCTEGAYWMENEVLPPERSIRESTSELLASLPLPACNGSGAPDGSSQLSDLLESLRRRVPGLESLSLTRGQSLAATTARDQIEREWLDRQIHRYFSEDKAVPEKLFVQQGEHAMLIMKQGPLAAVLMAGRSTTPEALFWAGEEAHKQVLAAESADRR